MMVLSVTTFDHRLDKRGTIMKTRLRFRIPTDNYEDQLPVMKTKLPVMWTNIEVLVLYWYWYSEQCADTMSTVQCTGTLCNVLIQWAMYWHSVQFLAQYAMYWYSMQCTGTVCNVLVQRAMYWYSVQCTSTVYNIRVHWTQVLFFIENRAPPWYWPPIYSKPDLSGTENRYECCPYALIYM